MFFNRCRTLPFFVTAYFTYRNVRATEANVKATEEKQVTERFSKAVELLGSEKLEVRMGAIYALERIAKDSPKDHWTIMEVLTSLVREKSQTRHIPNIKITIDIQSALAVIGRRDSSKDSEYGRLDLSNTNLQQANLSNLYCQGFVTIDTQSRLLALSQVIGSSDVEVISLSSASTSLYCT